MKAHVALYYTLRMAASCGVGAALGFLRSVAFGSTVRVQPRGIQYPFSVRSKTTDAAVAAVVFAKREYRTPKTGEVKLILDLGGNVGYSAIFFANHYPQAKIVVLEPEPTNFEALKANVAPYANIIPVKKGVWWRRARLRVTNPDAQSMTFRFEEADDGDVECVSIDDLLAEHPTDGAVMVKMDIEGSEREIFAREAPWLGKTAVLQLEIHHGCWKPVLDRLSDYTYDAELSGENLVVDFTAKPLPTGCTAATASS